MLYFGLYDEAARRLEGPLLIAPDDAANLLPARLRGRGRQRRRAASPKLRARAASASRRSLPSFSRAPPRSPRSPRRAARRFPSLRPLYLASARRKPQAQTVARALMPVETQSCARQDRSMPASMAAIHRECFREALGRGRHGAVPRAPEDALPDRLGRRRRSSGVMAGLLIARKAADEAEILTFGVAPACRNQGLGRALLQKRHRALARQRREAAVSRSGGRQRSGAPTLSLLRRSARRPAARLLRARRRRRDLQPCPLTAPCR